MLNSFIHHIQSKSLLLPHQTYLLACSGGKDSMCLADLMLKARLKFEVAHVNFQLRGLDSEEDELFVKDWATENKLVFHGFRASTDAFAREKGLSIQMAAREIRYSFLEETRRKRGLGGIVLAHHEDDQLETIFLNLLRGTGIEGVYGMAEKKSWLIRPLLIFSGDQIVQYNQKNNLKWREDISNQKDDYKRNNLRINGLPAILGLQPDARQNLLRTFERLKDTGKAFFGLYDQWLSQMIIEKKGMQLLAYKNIVHMPGSASLLHFWLRSYGFNSDQTQKIANQLTEPTSGKSFSSDTHVVYLDREHLILAPITGEFHPIWIKKDDHHFALPEGNFEIHRLNQNFSVDTNPNHAMLDSEILEFPLEVRTWQEGDRFIPLGMKNPKKISDFLIDLKIPMAEKQKVKVLISGSKIAWVIGIRIADWAKLTAATREVIYLKKLT
jgi:tRNA(Ile)-lysidine synthase